VRITGVQTGTQYVNVNHSYNNTVDGYTTRNITVTVPAGSADRRLNVSFESYNNPDTYGVLIDDVNLVFGATPAGQFSIGGPDVVALNTPANFSFVNGPATGATYTWNFGTNSTPGSSSSRTPSGIRWTSLGNKVVMARVSNGTCNVITLTKVVTVDAVLPMKIHSFTGTVNVTGNELAWTAENLNRQQGSFIIERVHTNGFDSLGSVLIDPAARTSTYAFTDTRPLQGANQYRLRMTGDKSGLAYSKVIALVNQPGTAVFRLFPNPAISFVEAAFVSAKEGQSLLQVVGMNGVVRSTQKWVTLKGNNQARIDVSALPSGNYVLRLTFANGLGHTAIFAKR
jgi:hypothetical protein